MKKVFLYVLLIAVIILAVSTARPFWNKYWLGKEIETAAVYGTKHTIENTRSFLAEKMKTEGYRFRGEDFKIEKDEKNNVTITLQYKDAISAFGFELKNLEFAVERSVSETKQIL